jgi:predicted TIM-barrel fold metal-dependent hydrolase
MGFNPIGLRAAVEMCGADRVVFGSDYGPVPYGIEEHVRIVEDVLPSPAERQQVFWKTSNRVFRLGLSDTRGDDPEAQHCASGIGLPQAGGGR